MKTKALLVDDNLLTQTYIQDIFWVHGLAKKIDLTMAQSFDDAWAQIQSNPPKIIILDLSLPKSQGTQPETTMGLQLLEKIKADPATKDIEVIIYSGFSDLKYREQAKQLGALQYLVKDENLPQDLVNLINELLA